MEDKYTELTIKTKPEFVELLADFIMSAINEAVEFGEDRVILRTTEDTKELEEQLNELSKTLPLHIKKEEKENIDWIQKYKDSIKPIEASEFYIHPTWHTPKEGKINIIINPALAFGSGHHATTYSCLEAISKYVKNNQTLLDVGCGSGILALAAKKKGAVVELCDTDPLAVDSAKENFELNNEEYNKIWVGSANKSEAKYDIVVANIIADVLKAINLELKNKLKSNSLLILSGILDKKENIVTDVFSDLELIERIKKDEWITLIYKKKDING
jgi:ribosomal protein L11 methyltransferase